VLTFLIPTKTTYYKRFGSLHHDSGISKERDKTGQPPQTYMVKRVVKERGFIKEKEAYGKGCVALKRRLPDTRRDLSEAL